uniref:VWFA domain-containing protein n=1 Tax=Ditylenchus dipsaci TaxID=166011 RepID=A0A915CT24_9BILA
MNSAGLWAIPLLLFLLLWCRQECEADTYYKPPDPDLYPAQVVTKMDGVDIPPPGMSSLTFVFDRTGSMNDDLDQKLIHNYVLVLFHDPDVDPPFVSTDPDVFQQELASKALEVSLPGSYIYVFTDARSKDYHLEDRVLNLIQEKQSSVVFVMTGDCGNRSSPGYRVFEKIAAASFGQVFHLEKSHVNTVLEYVRHSVAQRKVQ